MIKTEKVSVNEQDFEITQFAAREALKLQRTLGRHFGAPLASLVGGKGSILDADTGSSEFANAVEKLFSSMDDEDFFKLVLRLFSKTKKNGILINEETFDQLFGSDYLSIYKLIYKVLEVNFGDFLSMVTTKNQEVSAEVKDQASKES